MSIISEPFLEAANYTSIDAPYDVDEWKLSGLTQRQSQSVPQNPVHTVCYVADGHAGWSRRRMLANRPSRWNAS